MNQETHAWLAVEAYRKIKTVSETPVGKKKKLDGLASLLGTNLRDVVVAAWLPDSLIKDMSYGHVFKNAAYNGSQVERFTLSKSQLRTQLAKGAAIPDAAFPHVPAEWWAKPYRVKPAGGHLPARVNALCQTARDMFKMGDKDVVALTGIKPEGATPIADTLLYSPRNVAMMLWMASHYIADSHMPFHCDNRALAGSNAKEGFKAHGQVEDEWGTQVPILFAAKKILKMTAEDILASPLPPGSQFTGLDFGTTINPLKNNGDPWKECVYICRASFATSFALIPSDIAPVDDKKIKVSLDDIRNNSWCGEARFWNISKAIMSDAVSAIAMFWQDAWCDFVNGGSKEHS